MIDESVCNSCGEKLEDHFEVQAARQREDNRGYRYREAEAVYICPTAIYEEKPFDWGTK